MKKFLLILLACIIIYHIGEYIYIRHQVKNLCKKEAGVFVYVTPEQWKEENKGGVGDVVKAHPYDWELKKLKLKNIIVDGIEYKPRIIYKSATYYWHTRENSPNRFTDKTYNLLVDNKTGKVLMKSIYFSTGVGKWFQGTATSYKFWMNEVPSCSYFGSQFNAQEELYH